MPPPWTGKDSSSSQDSQDSSKQDNRTRSRSKGNSNDLGSRIPPRMGVAGS